MSSYSDARLEQLAVHRVGNKSREEGFTAATEVVDLQQENLSQVLQQYFLNSFKQEEYYRFTHPTELALNEMYTFATRVFTEPGRFLVHSVEILKHLYEQSEHPRIKSGELYIAYFTDILIEDELVDAVGIFKSENKDTFLTFGNEPDSLQISCSLGVPAKQADKGCLIFNADPDDGYRIKMVDANSSDAHFWKDDFLKITDLQDYNYTTKTIMNLCRDFSEEVFADTQDHQEKRRFLNKSVEYFASNDTFDLEEFTESVIENPEAAEKFKSFNKVFAEERGIEKLDDFKISKSAVKTMKRKIKNHIKLDTQIEIRLNAKEPEQAEQYVERGYDEERGMHFYKVFFHTED